MVPTWSRAFAATDFITLTHIKLVVPLHALNAAAGGQVPRYSNGYAVDRHCRRTRQFLPLVKQGGKR